MYYGFFCRNKNGSHLHSFGAKHYRCRKPPAVSNASRSHYRNVDRICHLRYQCHCCCLSNMTTRFHAFRNHRIRPRTLHQLRHCNAGYYRDNLNSGIFPHLHKFARISGSGCHYFNALFDDRFRHLFRIWVQQHNVNPHRLIRQFLGFPYLLPDNFRRCAGCANQSKPSGFRYGRRKMIFRHPCHSALYHRIFNSQQFGYSRFHFLLSILLRPFARWGYYTHKRLSPAIRLMPLLPCFSYIQSLPLPSLSAPNPPKGFQFYIPLQMP